MRQEGCRAVLSRGTWFLQLTSNTVCGCGFPAGVLHAGAAAPANPTAGPLSSCFHTGEHWDGLRLPGGPDPRGWSRERASPRLHELISPGQSTRRLGLAELPHLDGAFIDFLFKMLMYFLVIRRSSRRGGRGPAPRDGAARDGGSAAAPAPSLPRGGVRDHPPQLQPPNPGTGGALQLPRQALGGAVCAGAERAERGAPRSGPAAAVTLWRNPPQPRKPVFGVSLRGRGEGCAPAVMRGAVGRFLRVLVWMEWSWGCCEGEVLGVRSTEERLQLRDLRWVLETAHFARDFFFLN